MKPDSPQDNSWFTGTLQPIEMPDAPTKKKRPIKLIVGVIAGVTLLGAGGLLFYLSSQPTQIASCLSRKDYYALSGSTKNSDTTTENNEYVALLWYPTGSLKPEESDADVEKLLDRIASFYVKNAEKNLPKISFSQMIATSDDSEIAASRSDAIIKSLLKKGVPDTLITFGPIEEITGEGLEPNAKELIGSTLKMSISSDTTCDDTK